MDCLWNVDQRRPRLPRTVRRPNHKSQQICGFFPAAGQSTLKNRLHPKVFRPRVPGHGAWLDCWSSGRGVADYPSQLLRGRSKGTASCDWTSPLPTDWSRMPDIRRQKASSAEAPVVVSDFFYDQRHQGLMSVLRFENLAGSPALRFKAALVAVARERPGLERQDILRNDHFCVTLSVWTVSLAVRPSVQRTSQDAAPGRRHSALQSVQCWCCKSFVTCGAKQRGTRTM